MRKYKKRFELMEAKVEELKKEEMELLANKKPGREDLSDLITVRDLQDACMNECINLVNFMSNKKIFNMAVLEDAKRLCCFVIERINQHIAI